MSIKLLLTKKVTIGLVSFCSILGVIGFIYFYSSKNAVEGKIKFNPAFKPYISAYTGGYISRESPIQVKFVSDVAQNKELNIPIEDDLFDFDPNIKGNVIWVDKNTIQFQPEEPMPSGSFFKVSFDLGKVMQMPEELKLFDFDFQVMPQSCDVTIDGLRPYDVYDLGRQKIIGTMVTADVADNENVEKVFKATQKGKDLKVTWVHEADRRNHLFTVENIERTSAVGSVKVEWDGSPIGAENKGSQEYSIPALGEFVIMSAKAVQGVEQYAELQFSDPILEDQDIEGLITIQGIPDLRVVIDGNLVKAYPPVRQVGLKTLTIHEGVKNVNKKSFKPTQTIELNFEELKPAVRLIGKGVIMPSTDSLQFPFEAVGLKSVKVKVLKVFENNITQFFQVNNFEGRQELRRVGKTVLNKTISLNTTSVNDYGRWKRYALDLADLIKAEPGAIYQIKISFSKSDAMYSCLNNTLNKGDNLILEEENNEDEMEDESSYWDYYDDYYYAEEYNYQERDNPCTDSYYGDYRAVTRNVLASDLGVIAKVGNSGNLVVAVTDIKTTKPVDGAKVDVYDFQQQVFLSGNTNGDGLSNMDLERKPFMLIVKKDNQVGYLKLDDPSALSLTNFDVAGAKIQKGIKGFLYGERGVWRPGDSLFLTFIVENKSKKLPKNQPVIFELTNPQGQITKRIVQTSPVGNFYNFNTSTSSDDPTGNWMAKVKVGGATFSYPIKIEMVMPNRLKIKMDFGTDKLTSKDKSLQGNLDVKWLHGAVAKNLDADISMHLVKAETKFDKFPEYTFDDPAKDFNAESMEIFDGQIDDNGNAKVDARINMEGNAPGMLTANFKVKVMEEGGSFSVDRFSMPYYPYNFFTGIRLPSGDKARNMLLTDTNHTVDIVVLDPNGRPVGDKTIEMQLFKVEWRWWWDNSEGNNISAYLDNSSRTAIIKETVTAVNGKAKWKFRVNYPEWGRYYLRAYDPESKHSTGKIIYMDWPGWAGSSTERNQGGASMLSFTMDKEKYNVGEKVNLTIPGSAEGRALVSIESGSKVVETHWVETVNGKNSFSFTATENMTPNVYVNVTLIQPHVHTRNDLPIRLYGVVPMRVENPQTFLKPVITMKQEVRPEENVTINIKESAGKSMSYTVAVVDEGLLDITRFKTPEPWNYFYAREALGVNSWDMYDFVMGAFGQKMDRLLSIGGDGEIKGSEGSKAKRFKPVVKFFGPFQLESNGNATHTFKMPQYIGSVKTMVIAGNEEGAYGSSEFITAVKKPLMVLATLPRVLGPDEYVALPVSVFAMTKNVKNVSIQVKTNNMFELVEGNNKSISFNQPGDEVVNFYLKVKSMTGIGKISVTASGGGESAKDEITIEVRNPNIPVTRVIENVIQPNSTWAASYEAFGMAGSNTGMLEVSNIPPINLGERLKYLITYPYGCVEQTISSVFPQLYVMDLIAPSDAMAKRTEENIKSGIQRLKSFQATDGGLSYWPGASEYNDWGTSYAGHFMIEAEKKGYSLPPGFMGSWKVFQKKVARNFTYNGYNSDLIQAYRLYTLALAGEAELGAMNRLRESKKLSPAAQWRLAAAYHLAGQSDVAKSLALSAPTSVKVYKEMDYTFGSDIRDKAMILEVLNMLEMKPQAVPLVKDISAALSGKTWMSTQEIAYCLLAVSKYSAKASAGPLNFTYTLRSEKPVNAVTDMKIAQVGLKMRQSQTEKAQVKNNTSGTLYSRIMVTGIPKPGEEVAAENNLKISIVYKGKGGSIISPDVLEQGTDFVAEVTVSNPGMRGVYKNLALKQIFPSGWEIHNTRLDGFDFTPQKTVKKSYSDYEEGEEDYAESLDDEVIIEEGSGSQVAQQKVAASFAIPTYQDIRDDRVYSFFDLNPRESKTFRISLNAAYLGKFYLPVLYSEAMYDGSINATIPGKWVEVIKPGEKGVSLK